MMKTVRFGKGFGHTTAMLEGAKNTKGVVIVAHTQKYADELARQCPDARGIGLDRVDRLRGSQLPILIDHLALQMMLQERDDLIAQIEVKAKHFDNILWIIRDDDFDEEIMGKIINYCKEHNIVYRLKDMK